MLALLVRWPILNALVFSLRLVVQLQSSVPFSIREWFWCFDLLNECFSSPLCTCSSYEWDYIKKIIFIQIGGKMPHSEMWGAIRRDQLLKIWIMLYMYSLTHIFTHEIRIGFKKIDLDSYKDGCEWRVLVQYFFFYLKTSYLSPWTSTTLLRETNGVSVPSTFLASLFASC